MPVWCGMRVEVLSLLLAIALQIPATIAESWYCILLYTISILFELKLSLAMFFHLVAAGCWSCSSCVAKTFTTAALPVCCAHIVHRYVVRMQHACRSWTPLQASLGYSLESHDRAAKQSQLASMLPAKISPNTCNIMQLQHAGRLPVAELQ